MILVFGGHGQLGQELTRTPAAMGTPFTALARADADIGDSAAVKRAIDRVRPSLVVNAAAYTNVDRAEADCDTAERNNTAAPALIAAACAVAEIPLIHMSTDYVFGGEKLGAYVETDPVAPLGVYGRTKAAGEQAVRVALDRHIILRTSWLYGAFGQNFLKTVLRLTAEQEELRIVADQRGSPTSTRDLAAAILRIAPDLIAGKAVWGTYHFAGTGVTTWHGFAERIVAAQAPLTGRRPPVRAVTTAEFPRPARRPANSALDCSRFARVFGFSAGAWEREADAVTRAVVQGSQAYRAGHVA